MFCEKCGAAIVNGVCPACGEAAPSAPVDAAPEKVFPFAQPLSRKEFYKQLFKKKGFIITAAVLGFISVLFTFIAMLSGLNGMDAMALIDVVLILACSLGILIWKSRVFAVALLVYACINTVISLIVFQAFGGWLIIIAGILGVIGTFAYAREWKAYQAQF